MELERGLFCTKIFRFKFPFDPLAVGGGIPEPIQINVGLFFGC